MKNLLFDFIVIWSFAFVIGTFSPDGMSAIILGAIIGAAYGYLRSTKWKN